MKPLEGSNESGGRTSLSIQKLMEKARRGRDRRDHEAREAAEAERRIWSERLSQMLDDETWKTLGVDPLEAQKENHHHPNAYQSLGAVLTTGGSVDMEDTQGERLGVTVLMPMVTPMRAELRLAVAPVHGSFDATLWYPSALVASDSPEGEKVAAGQQDNARRVGEMLVRFVEFRDSPDRGRS